MEKLITKHKYHQEVAGNTFEDVTGKLRSHYNQLKQIDQDTKIRTTKKFKYLLNSTKFTNK